MFDLSDYLSPDGVIDDERLANDTCQALIALTGTLEAAGWNTSLSFRPAAETVVNHLRELFGNGISVDFPAIGE